MYCGSRTVKESADAVSGNARAGGAIAPRSPMNPTTATTTTPPIASAARASYRIAGLRQVSAVDDLLHPVGVGGICRCLDRELAVPALQRLVAQPLDEGDDVLAPSRVEEDQDAII